MKKLWIKSCHASVEYDQARMFTDIGYKVSGDFDIGSFQRPKVPNVTDHNEPCENPDVVILHQVRDYTVEFKNYADKHKTVLIAFGQTSDWQYMVLSHICEINPNAYIAAYSQHEYNCLVNRGCPKEKLRLIRFGKYLEDYPTWKGDWPTALVTTNSIHKRGEGCGWAMVDQLRKELPVILSGKETDEVGGLGEMTWQGVRNLYSHCQVLFSTGTMPASMVMTQMDGFLSGIPVVIWDNGYGIANEPLPGVIISNDYKTCVQQCKKILEDAQYREQQHQVSSNNRHLWDVRNIQEQWKELLEVVTGG